MSYVVVDASVWVARLVPQDVFHTDAKAWMEAQRDADVELISPALMLAEVAGAISRRTGDPKLGLKAIERLERLPRLRQVELDRELAREAAQLASELGLRGADATYAAIAARLDIPLVTLDRDQHKRASGRIAVHSI